MAVLKCKMCGGDLNITEGMSVCECEFCGTKQTVPTADNEKKMTLFARANRLRQGNEFDKASGVYESIVSEFPEEAEAYWGIVLCRYGIEYVDDPLTGKKVPTCHRSSFDSVMDDPDFDQALENADAVARKVYRDEAKQIEEIRKGIIEVSGKEAPYDIFICYKETDENGERTIDSVIAQDVYDALTDKGYRAFFSRISLEDKLGTEYEPYIFAALNSAKIMLAFGTDYEYFNAVWVKNEWSRYLRLMAADKTKHLIPCYKGIDAYDMPKEFSRLQAQDMGKVGAIQDLLRGIEKILGPKEKQPQEPLQQMVFGGGKNAMALLTRGFNALEDGAFEEAKKHFDEALSIDASSAEAYLGLFMADMEVRNREGAKEVYISQPCRDNRNWKRACQYAAGNLAEELKSWEEEKTKKENEEIALRNRRVSEIDALREQLKNGQFEFDADYLADKDYLNKKIEEASSDYQTLKTQFDSMPEKEEASRLDQEITAKKQAANALGIFKGKEKKKLLEEVAILENRVSKCRNVLSQKENAIQAKKKSIDDLKNRIATREKEWKNRKQEEIQRRIDSFDILENNQKTLKFGRYIQNQGISSIEWLVLKVEDQRALLISKYVLDCQPFDDRITGYCNGKSTWKTSTLRPWLNNTFLNKAFTQAERTRIPTVTISENDESDGISYIKDSIIRESTQDKVFLLSISEAKRYFESDESRKCHGTAYCEEQQKRNWQGGEYLHYKSNSKDWYWWRLRTCSKIFNNCVANAYVNYDGAVNEFGDDGTQNRGDVGIRPTMWIDLKP